MSSGAGLLAVSGGPTLSARSRIAFAERSELERLLNETGLYAQEWFGDWAGGPAGAGRPEIIVLGGRNR